MHRRLRVHSIRLRCEYLGLKTSTCAPRKGRERGLWSAASLPCLRSLERGSSDRRHLIPMVPPGVQFRVAAERSAGVLRRPERCQRQSLISCAATLGRSGPTTAGAGHPGTANAGDGALPGLAISAAGQPTFCAPRLSHTWVDTMQIEIGRASCRERV